MACQDKERPLLQAAPPLQSGSAAPPEPVGIPGAPHAPVGQEEGRVPRQKQRPAAQQLVEQRLLVVALGHLQRQRPWQGPVAAQQAEQLQVRTSTPKPRRTSLTWPTWLTSLRVCVHRERDSPGRSDDDSRARRRSRSYSPIRKRRRDSPSFMEARRITR